MMQQATFCFNDLCEFFDVKAGRNDGDRLVLSDKSVVKRHAFANVKQPGGRNVPGHSRSPRLRLFCDACTNAIRLARYQDERSGPEGTNP